MKIELIGQGIGISDLSDLMSDQQIHEQHVPMVVFRCVYRCYFPH